MKSTATFAPKPMRRRVLQAVGEVERQLFKRKFRKGKLVAAARFGGLALAHAPLWIRRKSTKQF